MKKYVTYHRTTYKINSQHDTFGVDIVTTLRGNKQLKWADTTQPANRELVQRLIKENPTA